MNHDIHQELCALWQIHSGEYQMLQQLDMHDFVDADTRRIFVCMIDCCDGKSLDFMGIEDKLAGNRKAYWWLDLILGNHVYTGAPFQVVQALKKLRARREAEGFKVKGEDEEMPDQFIEKGREIGEMLNMKERSVEEIVQRIKSGVPRVPTGYQKMDFLCKGGMEHGGIFVIAARPGVGKTTLAVNIAKNVVADGKTVCFITLEMPEEGILSRFMQCMYESTEEEVKKNIEDMAKYPTGFVVMQGKYDLPKLLTQMTQNLDADLFILDYFSLIQVQSKEGSVQKLEYISNKLKQFAFENEKPLLLLHQMNRSIETDKRNREPELSDLRGCGALEQDAHVVSFLWDAAKKEQDEEPQVRFGKKEEKEFATLLKTDLRWILKKNRNGMIGYVPMQFKPNTMTFIQSQDIA